MIKNIPLVEMAERIKNLAREKASSENIIRGIINDVYTKDISREYDWSFLKSSSAISCIAEYNTGYVTVNTQGTVCTFQSGAAITSAMTGRKIKFDGNSNIYDFTQTGVLTGAINPPLSGEANVGSGGYVIFQDTFSLASDFDRFPVNGGLLFYSAGQPTPIPEKMDDDWYAEYIASPTSEPGMCRIVEPDTAGNIAVQINPPPQDPTVIAYEYIKQVNPMSFETGGTVVTISNSTIITGTGTFFARMTTGDYFRVDNFGIGQDSDWYRISVISSDSDLTLSTNFRATTAGGAFTDYAISSAPQMPYRIQDAIIAGAMRHILMDQNDKNFLFYHAQFAKVLSDNKILYKSRNAKDDIELIAENSEYRR